MSAWRCFVCSAWPVVLLGACVVPSSWRHAGQDDRREPIEHRFVLESTLRARRLQHGQADMHIELDNDATVIDGDRLQVSIRTSQDAYLYIAFCSQHASDPRYPGLTVFPDKGALRVKAYETTVAPDRAAEIAIDDQPGQEALYLILSRVELSRAESGLAQVIAAARQGNESTDCTPLRGAPRRSPRASSGSQSGGPRPSNVRVEADPVIEIQRGGDIVWSNGAPPAIDGDPRGAVVLRFGLHHVSAP